MVHTWVERGGLDSSAYGIHTMRRTKAARIYRKAGKLRAVQLLLGHTGLESTARYLVIGRPDDFRADRATGLPADRLKRVRYWSLIRVVY